MDKNGINCEICGAEVHSLQKHLEKEHSEGSDSPMTLDEYKSKFPKAPLFSSIAENHLIKKMNQMKKESVLRKEQEVQNKMIQMPLYKLFGLEQNSETLRELDDGSQVPIMANYFNCSKQNKMVPIIDDSYIFNVEYIKTILMGLHENIPVYLYGHSGVGKSTILEQICARLNLPMIRLQHTINTEESHIIGQWIVKQTVCESTGKKSSQMVFELGPLALAMKNGWVYLADEYDKGDPGVLAVYQAVLEGKPLYINEADEENSLIIPHPNFRIVATGNTNGSGDETGIYSSTEVQDAATIERFGILLEIVNMSVQDETNLLIDKVGIHEEDSELLLDFCDKIRKKYPNEISLPLGNRTSLNIAKIGLMKGSFVTGVELCFANRLPENEKLATMQVAERILGD